jgi:hypothetical protein
VIWTLIFPRTLTIEEAVKHGGDQPIVLLDDFTGNGSQVLDILGTWFDRDDLRQEQLGEARLPFNEEERVFLRMRPVGFVFLAAWNAGLDRIRVAAGEIGLNATVYAHLGEHQLPFAFDGALQEYAPDLTARFKNSC